MPRFPININQLDLIGLSGYLSGMINNTTGELSRYLMDTGNQVPNIVYATDTDQVISGKKTFIEAPKVPYTGGTGDVVARQYVTDNIAASTSGTLDYLRTAPIMFLTGDQAISGIKNFVGAQIRVPTGTTLFDAVNFGQFNKRVTTAEDRITDLEMEETALSGYVVSGAAYTVYTTGDQTISGRKSFLSGVNVPYSGTTGQAISRKYVDDVSGYLWNNTVHLTGQQTISGDKTFSNHVFLQNDAVNPRNPVTYRQFTGALSGISGGGVVSSGGVSTLNALDGDLRLSGASGIRVRYAGANKFVLEPTTSPSIIYIKTSVKFDDLADGTIIDLIEPATSLNIFIDYNSGLGAWVYGIGGSSDIVSQVLSTGTFYDVELMVDWSTGDMVITPRFSGVEGGSVISSTTGRIPREFRLGVINAAAAGHSVWFDYAFISSTGWGGSDFFYADFSDNAITDFDTVYASSVTVTSGLLHTSGTAFDAYVCKPLDFGALIAQGAGAVYITGDQTISGDKTFTGNCLVPPASSGQQAVPYSQFNSTGSGLNTRLAILETENRVVTLDSFTGDVTTSGIGTVNITRSGNVITFSGTATAAAWRDGVGAPSNGLGANGDFYLDDATANVYTKVGGTYSIVSNIRGATGSVWRDGTGVPSNSLGIDGDYYLRDTTSDVYAKVTGVYSVVTNIKGATGATGPTGVTGPIGPTGATGASTQWHDGNGVPSNGLGSDGDYYLDDVNGNIYAKSGGIYANVSNISSGLAGRQTVTYTTSSIADDATEVFLLTMPKTAAIISVQTDYAAWVRVYGSTAERTADSSRAIDADPTPGAGVMLDGITATGALKIWTSPVATFTSHESTPTGAAPVSLRNRSGGTRASGITLTVAYLQLEK